MLRTVATISLSFCVCAWMAGCGSDQSQSPADLGQGTADASGGHSHPSETPHGGHLIELAGGEYHAELLHDDSSHSVTVYLLDSAGEEPVGIQAAEITLQAFDDGQFVDYTLTAVDAADEQAGSSQFQTADEALGDLLGHAGEFSGRLQVTIEGRQLTGVIELDAHDHDAHADDDHGDEDDGDHADEGDDHADEGGDHDADEGHDNEAGGHDDDADEGGDHDADEGHDNEAEGHDDEGHAAADHD